MFAPIATSNLAVHLARRWVVDYFNRHDAATAREFIAPEYALRIGDYLFAGRDEQWLPAVDQQFALFPGMGMTVHQVLAGADWAAVYFTEHGASKGKAACWSGVAIYRSAGDKLVGCVAQEDYLTRQRQLKSGVADAMEPPAVAPWDTAPLPANPAAEAVVQRWLQGSWPSTVAGVRCDDEHITGVPLAFEVRTSVVGTLLSSGDAVAFHVQQSGHYSGGLSGVPGTGQAATLHANGIVRVVDGQVVQGRVIRNRLDLRATLLTRKDTPT